MLTGFLSILRKTIPCPRRLLGLGGLVFHTSRLVQTYSTVYNCTRNAAYDISPRTRSCGLSPDNNAQRRAYLHTLHTHDGLDHSSVQYCRNLNQGASRPRHRRSQTENELQARVRWLPSSVFEHVRYTLLYNEARAKVRCHKRQKFASSCSTRAALGGESLRQREQLKVFCNAGQPAARQ